MQTTDHYSIKKYKTALLDDVYNHPKTSCLMFSFETEKKSKIGLKLLQSQIVHVNLQGKSLYVFDNFFQKKDAKEMKAFFEASSFSRSSYGSAAAVLQGERPAKTMNGKERYMLFEKPPGAIQEVFKLLGYIALQTQTQITTLPWELCDKDGNGSSAIIVNKLERSTPTSRELGRHKDVNPEKKISFGIPKLYQAGELFESTFTNGAPGKPWLVTLMLYTTASNYCDSYQMGTVFYRNTGPLAIRLRCRDMRIVLFEGDIEHSIEESSIGEEVVTWRVSTVFKLVINPTSAAQSAKNSVEQFFKNYAQDLIYSALEELIL
jgi:hypothetical protein